MGIYDREYYRDESGGSGWFSGIAPACKTIIIVNVVLFLAFFSRIQSPIRAELVANASDIFRHGKVWQLLTAAFIHDSGSIFHVGWNMLFLWVVGREMEERYGSREFTIFYLTAAIFSSLCWALSDLVFAGGTNTACGASGAVLAVVTLYVCWYPRREMLLFFILPVEAWMLLALYLASDAVMMLQDVQGIGVGPAFATGFAAHLGGAGYGFLYKRFDLRVGQLFSTRGRKPKLRVVSPPRDQGRERPTPAPATSSRSANVVGLTKANSPSLFPEEQLSARLDEVLAKIARDGGRSGLTEEENVILQEASRRARDRRSDRP